MIKNYPEKYLKDPYNELGKRNPKNVNRYEVNCGGRALGFENWFCPYEDEDDSVRLFDDWESDLTNNERLQETVDWMLNNVPGLRKVQGKEDLQPGERLIAYRCATSDFHFMYMNENGLWFSKQGSGKTKRVSEKTVFAKEWINGYNIYNSDLVLFAKKIKKD